jgi:subtilisin family serine protease
MEALAKNPHVKFAELDEAMRPELIPNDPYYGNAWHLPRIDAPSAWDASTGLGVTVAILDTGVDATHPDLIAALVPGWNTYDNNSNSSDVHGHGTAVAGTAAASGANAAGVAGVAWRARIMPVRVTDTAGYAYVSTLSSGITWAADHGARVANASFSVAAGSSTIATAAQYMRSKGGVVVVAAGNSGIQEAYAPSPSR